MAENYVRSGQLNNKIAALSKDKKNVTHRVEGESCIDNNHKESVSYNGLDDISLSDVDKGEEPTGRCNITDNISLSNEDSGQQPIDTIINTCNISLSDEDKTQELNDNLIDHEDTSDFKDDDDNAFSDLRATDLPFDSGTNEKCTEKESVGGNKVED